MREELSAKLFEFRHKRDTLSNCISALRARIRQSIDEAPHSKKARRERRRWREELKTLRHEHQQIQKQIKLLNKELLKILKGGGDHVDTDQKENKPR